MTSALRIDVAGTRGQTIALTVAGELDLTTTTDFLPSMQDALINHLTVILDLTGVTFCDSSGLNTLIRLRHRAMDASGQFVLVAPPQQMLRLLNVTGVGRISPSTAVWSKPGRPNQLQAPRPRLDLATAPSV
ncbi:STAS domain-containing protein [Streptomyces sp. MS2.AVA.5]|uniref:STAS domain-containing protein n=1 Tax=Streptomyces achmelvichensis TaxID=3134111 RepID=A0ACC6PLD0_9ACTN